MIETSGRISNVAGFNFLKTMEGNLFLLTEFGDYSLPHLHIAMALSVVPPLLNAEY